MNLFALQFTMREAWDLPEDDELLDACLESDWVDLGTTMDAGEINNKRGDDNKTHHGEEGKQQDGEFVEERPNSPRAVLQGRLRQVLPAREDLYIFMDDSSLAS